MHLLLPLIAAIAFALGSLVFKRAFAEGAGIAHAVVINNVVLGILFLPLMAFESGTIPWDRWYQPVLTASTFVLGHLLNVVSIRMGDVSVATPLLGAKVIFVALIGRWVFGVHLVPAQWAAAALASAGVVVMGITDVRGGGRTGLTTVTAMGCAASFAVTDSMIQAWGSAFGLYGFISLQFGALALLSLGILPVLGRSALRAPARAWKWIAGATALSGLQAIIVTVTIALWRDAAGVNVVYATRGLWSIALVWSIGHWLQNSERHAAGGRRMAVRLVGGTLILLAVVLAFRGAGRPGGS